MYSAVMLLGRLHNKLKVINMNNIENNHRYNYYVLLFYGFSIVWCLLLPSFDHNAAHYGWGFLPLMLSIFLVPALLVGLLVDFVYRAWSFMQNWQKGYMNIVPLVLSTVTSIGCFTSVTKNAPALLG